MKSKKCWHLTWLFFNSSSNCLIRDLDQAFIFRNLASDLVASSVFCFDWAAKRKWRESRMKWMKDEHGFWRDPTYLHLIGLIVLLKSGNFTSICIFYKMGKHLGENLKIRFKNSTSDSVLNIGEKCPLDVGNTRIYWWRAVKTTSFHSNVWWTVRMTNPNEKQPTFQLSYPLYGG